MRLLVLTNVSGKGRFYSMSSFVTKPSGSAISPMQELQIDSRIKIIASGKKKRSKFSVHDFYVAAF